MLSEYKINGITIKRPTSFKTEYYLVTDLKRLANGNMAGDLIAKKRKFYFTYAAITSIELAVILDALWNTDEIFHILTYIEDNVQKSVNVYVGSIPKDLARTGSVWVWKELTFNLIEQ